MHGWIFEFLWVEYILEGCKDWILHWKVNGSPYHDASKDISTGVSGIQDGKLKRMMLLDIDRWMIRINEDMTDDNSEI